MRLKPNCLPDTVDPRGVKGSSTWGGSTDRHGRAGKHRALGAVHRGVI